MARYRKIDVRIWGDEKFRTLKAPQPNGQTLWIYLLTGPFTTNIPGVSSVGEMAIAERLNWPTKGFREAFAEVLSKGMLKVDWTAPLIWIPKAIEYNKPESPNVVKSWSDTWDEIPECNLKDDIYQGLKAFMEGLDEAFGKAFLKACRKPSSKALPNQEQEQEQEQEVKAHSSKSSNASNLSDEEFIQSLKTNPAYKGIDVARELARMDAWLQTPKGKRRQKTRGFILNWLNRIDVPVLVDSMPPSVSTGKDPALAKIEQYEREAMEERAKKTKNSF